MAKTSFVGTEPDIIHLDPNAKGTRVDSENSIIGLEDERIRVRDFWQWAFSDLFDDDLKGWYAEWLKSILLGIRTDRRRSWANTDLVSPSGVRIEVKSSSYWQSWKLWDETGNPKPIKIAGDKERRRIRFSGLKVGDAVAPSPSNVGYKSDLYIFAFQSQPDPRLWNALDICQWEFYMLTRQELEAIGTKSISLDTVRAKCGAPMSAGEFRIQGREKLQEFAVMKAGSGASN